MAATLEAVLDQAKTAILEATILDRYSTQYSKLYI
jgi:hypothetical protein